MENDKREKSIPYILIVLSALIILVIGSAYAYFATGTTNNFGTTTIEGYADSTGTVSLVGTNAQLSIHLSGVDMAQGQSDITYYATSNGTPSVTENSVVVGSTSVTGNNYYNCSYTLSATATGTNNMYTAFQGMTGKSAGQIVLQVGSNTYDFNTANLFPITINGTLEGVTASESQSIEASLYVVNKSNLAQDALQGKDIQIILTATNFSCTAVEAPVLPVVSYFTCNDLEGTMYNPVSSPDDEWDWYFEKTVAQTTASTDLYILNNDDRVYLTQSECNEIHETYSYNTCVKSVNQGDTYDLTTYRLCYHYYDEYDTIHYECFSPYGYSTKSDYVNNGIGNNISCIDNGYGIYNCDFADNSPNYSDFNISGTSYTNKTSNYFEVRIGEGGDFSYELGNDGYGMCNSSY